MGWTWKDRYILLQLYPTLGTIPMLLERWPGLSEAVAALEAKKKAEAESLAGQAVQASTPKAQD